MAEASFVDRLKDASVTAIATVVVGALTLAGAIATGWFGFASQDHALRVHLVEIAIGILRADPKEDVAPARGWAIDIIEQDSGVKFSAEDRAALLHKPIQLQLSPALRSLAEDSGKGASLPTESSKLIVQFESHEPSQTIHTERETPTKP
jgi:hypothetical protein